MKRFTLVLAAAAALFCAGRVRAQLPAAQFKLGFESCSGERRGAPGSAVELNLLANLTTTNNDLPDGAQGWSISVASEGGLISEMTVEGVTVSTIYYAVKNAPPTDANKIQDLGIAGFVVAELQNAAVDAQPGAVSAIVINQQKKQVLQPNGVAQIARLKLVGVIPPVGSIPLRVFYKNGIVGSGEPVDNVITLNNKSVDPTFEDCSVPLTVQEGEFNLGLVPAGQRTLPAGDSEVIARSVPIPSGASTVDATETVEVLLNTAGLALLPFPDGPQGWSLGVAHPEPCMTVSDVTVEGVIVRTLFYGIKGEPPTDLNRLLDLGKAGFIVAEETVPESPRPGVVSAIVLNQQKKQVLHANATDPLLKIVYTVPVTADQTTNCRADIADGLLGSGEPVDTVITLNNKSKVPTRRQTLDVRLTGVPVRTDQFKRGDPNNDGKLDIADAIWIVQDVALDGDPVTCPDSGDANNDELYNVGDAVYIIQYQFQAGPAPPAPFPACGTDAGSNEQKCPPDSTLCPPVGA